MSTSTRDILLGAAAGLAAGAGLAYLLRKTYIIPHMPNPMHDATLCPYTPHMIYKHIDEGASAHSHNLREHCVDSSSAPISPEAGPVRLGMARSPHAFQLTHSPRVLPRPTHHTHYHLKNVHVS